MICKFLRNIVNLGFNFLVLKVVKIREESNLDDSIFIIVVSEKLRQFTINPQCLLELDSWKSK